MADENPEGDLVVGRSPGDFAKFGTKGAILLGKQFVHQDEKTFLGGNIWLEVAGAHVVFICGKRGGGKSYTMGVIAEGFTLLDEKIRENLSIIMLDTMGIYWTMTHGNKKEAKLLEPYGIKPRGIKLRIFTPEKFYHIYKEKGIPTDYPFSLNPAELDVDDWCKAFKQNKYNSNGVLIGKSLAKLRLSGKEKYTIDDIIAQIREDKEADPVTKAAVLSMFEMAEGWGVFSKDGKGTDVMELAKGGELTVLDVSCYATMPGGWDVKALVVGVVSQHLFVQRMTFRKGEEFAEVNYLEDWFSDIKAGRKQQLPLVWLVIDEAHEFLPKDEKDNSAATMPLIEIMREGRQPGISLILATQQPGKIHTDVMTQSDVVMSHRITARMDTEALSLLTQSYMKRGLVEAMDYLPRVKGAAVLFDDMNEKIIPIRVRPRFTWHGGASPTAIKEE